MSYPTQSLAQWQAQAQRHSRLQRQHLSAPLILSAALGLALAWAALGSHAQLAKTTLLCELDSALEWIVAVQANWH
jgi:hypothetical protein